MGLKIIKNTIPKGIQKEIKDNSYKMVTAVERGLEVIRSGIVPLVPVKTGRLKGSISSRVDKDAVYGIDSQKRGNAVVKVVGKIGTSLPYAAAVEFGTSRFSGRYYMTRGIENSKEMVQRVIYNTLKK